MSHFLQRLARRALGNAPGVQPRIPSRFEDGGGAMAAIEVREAVRATEQPPALRPVVGTRPEPERRRPTGSAPEPASPSRPRPRRDDEGSTPTGPPPRGTPRAHAAPGPEPSSKAETSRHPETPTRRPETVSGPRPAVPHRHPRAPSSETRLDTAPSPEPQVARGAAPPESPPSVTVRPTAVRVENRERRNPPSPRPGESESPSAQRASIRPRVDVETSLPVSRGERRNGSRQRTQDTPAEPAVRVTIGRVEVRAIQPASPPAPRRLPEPRLTLEDYLRQRREGRR